MNSGFRVRLPGSQLLLHHAICVLWDKTLNASVLYVLVNCVSPHWCTEALFSNHLVNDCLDVMSSDKVMLEGCRSLIPLYKGP